MYLKAHNQALQLTQKAPFVLCITLRFIIAQNKGHFLGQLNLALALKNHQFGHTIAIQCNYIIITS
jgi:hypothetical protein